MWDGNSITHMRLKISIQLFDLWMIRWMDGRKDRILEWYEKILVLQIIINVI